MNTRLVVLAIACALTPACSGTQPVRPETAARPPPRPSPYADPAPPVRRYLGRSNTEMYSLPIHGSCLRFPLGDATGRGARIAQIFQSERFHLGEDWVLSEGPSLGAPIHAIGDGVVIDAWDFGSNGEADGCWGRVVRVVHRLDEETWVESLYAHLTEIRVELGESVRSGQVLGTVGDAGCSGPHLHWELRESMNMPIGLGYGRDTGGYLEPSAFVSARSCD